MQAELPVLPSCRELQQRRARAYADARHRALLVHDYLRGPKLVAHLTARKWASWIEFGPNHARRVGLVRRLWIAVTQ